MVVPLELVEQFAKGNGCVFVGAGLSMGAGLPSWADLVAPLSRRLAQEIEERERRPFTEIVQGQISLPDVAQYYEHLTSRESLVDHLLETLGRQRYEPTSVHRKVVGLPVQRIFTTNFDRLLETACEVQKVKYRSVLVDQHLSLMSSAQKSIVKLHGDLGAPEKLILTSGDYERYLSEHPGIANLLGMDLHSKTVLFLGYSFSDIDLRMILSKVSRAAGDLRRTLFTVQLNSTELAKKELSRLGIGTLSLDTSSETATEALDKWLEEFIRRVRESPVRETVALQLLSNISFIAGKLPSRSGHFLGREEAFRRVMEGLCSRYPVVAIKGFAGVGKTRLAIEVGRACSLDRASSSTDSVIFEYVVWISGEDRPEQKRGLRDVLDAIATTTHNPAIAQTADEKEKEQQIEQLLRCYKILTVIDNFETMEDDSELIAWLERIPYPSKVLITVATRDSRSKPDAIAAWTVSLRGLQTAEALDWLRQSFPQQVNGLADDTLCDLARVTDGNPQVMKMALGLMQAGVPNLGKFIERLDEPGENPRKVSRYLFTDSWERLLEPARQILRVTPLFVGAGSIRRDALQAAAGLEDADFQQGLDQCLRFGLLERYHD